jgi:hypothetical protein
MFNRWGFEKGRIVWGLGMFECCLRSMLELAAHFFTRFLRPIYE